ncbi:MAG: hypothetical protein OXC06_08620 [Acidimicrobiaceae bacterium]|nr:hypothetical protein [Acidimicrobiaceae bacterium]
MQRCGLTPVRPTAGGCSRTDAGDDCSHAGPFHHDLRVVHYFDDDCGDDFNRAAGAARNDSRA